jgi:hypothetical protein
MSTKMFQLPQTTIAVDSLLHDHIADVAQAMGRSVDHVVDEALNRYMDEHGEPYLEYMWGAAFQEMALKAKGKAPAKAKRTAKRKRQPKPSNLIPFPA